MKYTTGRQGRVFVLRLEDGDVLHECVEQVAARESVQRAVVFFVGGFDKGSKLVVGPRDGTAKVIEPMQLDLENVYEAGAVGTIFPNEEGLPVLHMHAACGRQEQARVGCIRCGVNVWLVGEVVIWEITDCRAARKKQDLTGFQLLEL